MIAPFEIVKTVDLPAPADLVWFALTEPQGLAGWTMPIAPQRDSPTVTLWRDAQHLSLHIPTGDDGSFQEFDYKIEPLPTGETNLRFTHAGLQSASPQSIEMTDLAWDQYFATLRVYLRDFAHLVPAYIEAEAPTQAFGEAPSAAWNNLRAALGLDDDANVGASVRIKRVGVDPLEGTVDYLTERFVGVAGRDFLVRFHRREAIGLPIAVAHHQYLDPDHAVLDVESERLAWIDWLAEL